MKSISLNGIWKVTGKPQEGQGEALALKANVPGCVLLDLSREGFLPSDLFLGENLKLAEKFEEYEWWYEYTFFCDKPEANAFLVFEGVDCIAEYYLNERKIGESRNALIAHEFCVDSLLCEGVNSLKIHLSSPVIEAHQQSYTIASMLTWGNAPVETALRRPPHSYGWDIMPRAIGTGIWRDVRLEYRDNIRFSQLFVQATNKKCKLFYEIESRWSDFKEIEIELMGACEDSEFYVRSPISNGKAGVISFCVNQPRLWWPYGYGKANVYDARVCIYSRGILVHEKAISFGIRTVELDRTDGTNGKSGHFRFLINGVEIMCKGSNWVPLDAFHSEDKNRLDQALALAKDIGCNILRCWGGNVYEDEPFFDFCDRNGIMVWQDFAMACRIYPQTDSFKKQMDEEVLAVVRKLRNHPSVILWSGDNEIDQVYLRLGNPKMNHITREWIPRILEENDIGRPYLPSSPYISEAVYESKKDLSPSEDHLWGPRDYFKSSYYKENPAHFVSEIGYHGCPSMESIRRFIHPENVWPYNNSEWVFHSSDQKNNNARIVLMENQVRQLFGELPRNPDEFVVASQISQAEAKKYFIERMRVGRPNKSGIIWWNLLDGWPQISDAVVDYYFQKKLAYSYIKRSQAPFVIAADEIKNWNVNLYACNDTQERKVGRFSVIDGESEQLLLENDFVADANTSTLIGKLPVNYSDRKFFVIFWNCEGESGFNHFLCASPPVDLSWYQQLAQRYLF